MTEFTFLHAADLHLDTQVRGVSAIPDKRLDSLRDASLQAFDNLIDMAIQRNVAFCLFAGDIYDGVERGLRAQRVFLSGLQRLSDKGIHSFIVHGNHDPIQGKWSEIDDWPEHVTVFGSDEVGRHAIEVAGTKVVVHGMSFGEPAESRDLSQLYTPDHAADVNIAVLHCNVGGNANHDNYAPAALDGLTTGRLATST